jgi:3-oxoacyl-[acyl-carrier-protein] synthase II
VEVAMTGSFVVTGTGAVTAAGDTPQAILQTLLARTPLAGPRPEDGLVVAAMDAFDAKRYILKKGVKDLSRTSQLACSAAAATVRGLEGVAPEDVGVVFGTAWGSLKTVIDFEREAFVQGARFVDPILFTETVSNVPAGQVAILYGWSAFNATMSSGAASGLTGLRQALAFLEEGRGLVAVAGGGDELNAPVLRALRRCSGLTGQAGSLPLAAGRSGFAGGEAACFLTIESDEHARRRGAVAQAIIRASGSRFVPRSEAGTDGARESMAALIRHLTRSAGLELSAVDLVVLSASGLVGGDLEEAGAVIDVFGGGSAAVPVVSPKAILGETWGASGPLAAVVAIEAMRTSTVPAAPHGFVLAPDLSGLHVPEETQHRPIRNALILDRTDTGHQLGLVLSRVEPHDDRT